MPAAVSGAAAVPDSDFVAEAVHIAKALGSPRPVKVQWTREDDMRGGRYRPVSVHRLEAGLGRERRARRLATSGDWSILPYGSAIRGSDQKRGRSYARRRCTRAAIRNTALSLRHTHRGCRCANVMVAFRRSHAQRLRDRSVLRRSRARGRTRSRRDAARVVGQSPAPPCGSRPRSRQCTTRSEQGLAPAAEWPVHESFQTLVAEIADVRAHGDGRFSVERVTAAVRLWHCREPGYRARPDRGRHLATG